MTRHGPVIDAVLCECDAPPMQAKRTEKPTPKAESTRGSRLVAKYRPRMSALSDEERQRLMARGLQLIYGDAQPAKRASRG